ncbi:MAG: hypothetical protein KDK74_14600, partial [Cephaloticoccus sp.]|nr:hypothetical protein [Cephaloticoccus sp.]
MISTFMRASNTPGGALSMTHRGNLACRLWFADAIMPTAARAPRLQRLASANMAERGCAASGASGRREMNEISTRSSCRAFSGSDMKPRFFTVIFACLAIASSAPAVATERYG